MEYNFIKTSDKFKDGCAYYDKEMARLLTMYEYEKKWYEKQFTYIAGIDEVGRGPLAGPVVAGAVILPKGLFIEGANDSKKVAEAKREKLYDIILKEALAWGVGIVDNYIIDDINILNSAKLAMKQAIENLKVKPEALLIDAEQLKDVDIPQEGIIKGDALSHSIAVASIVAKVIRDRMMIEFDEEYPGYGFAKNKGYGTAEHISAIRNKGLCPIHRKTFTRNFVNGQNTESRI